MGDAKFFAQYRSNCLVVGLLIEWWRSRLDQLSPVIDYRPAFLSIPAEVASGET